MKTKIIFSLFLVHFICNTAAAQDVQLHVNPRWKECSFMLDPSLTQQEFRQFTREAGLVACFRPLSSAKPMGAGQFEVSLLKWNTKIDETTGAWNNTFVHPNAEHYLVGGDILSIPGITMRAGLTEKLDAGVYWTMNPGANYGFYGGQLQYNWLNSEKNKIDLSSRLGFNKLYGPDDVSFVTSDVALVVSKKLNLFKDWLSVSPYAGGSLYLTQGHEKSDLVSLRDENIFGAQSMFGAALSIYHLTLAAEYNFGAVNTFSYRLGYNFKLWSQKQNPAINKTN